MTACEIITRMGRVLGGVGLSAAAGAVLFLCAGVSVAPAAPAPAKARAEAARLLARFDASRDDYRRRHERTWRNAQAAGLAGGLAGRDGLPGAAVLFALYRQRLDAGASEFLLRQDDGPRDVLLSAARAARKAIEADPKDAQAHLLLGQAYARLALHTSERAWRRQLPALHRLRQVQIAAALNRALALQPGLLEAHAGLVSLYGDMDCVDLMAKHLRRVWERSRAIGLGKDETRQRFNRRIEQLKTTLDRVEKQATGRLDRYEVGTTGKSVGDKARTAMQLGLAGKALEVLLASDATTFGAAGARLELELLLSTGRVKEVGEWLTADVGEAIGMDSYHWLRLMHDAAVGDYEEADKHLHKMIAERNTLSSLNGKSEVRAQLARGFGQLVLDSSCGRESPIQLAWTAARQQQFRNVQEVAVSRLRQRADLFVLRGLLAREHGNDREAARHFREALGLWRNESAVSSGAGLDFAGRVLAQRGLYAVDR